MAEICGDNRFEIIEAAKSRLLDATNIKQAPDEMAVLDSILFRMWQMGWLPGGERAALTCQNALRARPYAKVFFKCSSCGFPESDSIDEQWLAREVNFCPNCGAKVVE